jgi:beta-aspartyl-dipeptidase (metallo-type)
MGSPDANLTEMLDIVNQEGLPLETALKVITSNPARILKLSHKGKLFAGADADIIAIDNGKIVHVLARGQWMMKENTLLKKGSYE